MSTPSTIIPSHSNSWDTAGRCGLDRLQVPSGRLGGSRYGVLYTHVTYRPLSGLRLRRKQLTCCACVCPGLKQRQRRALGTLIPAGADTDLHRVLLVNTQQFSGRSARTARRTRPTGTDTVAWSAWVSVTTASPQTRMNRSRRRLGGQGRLVWRLRFTSTPPCEYD